MPFLKLGQARVHAETRSNRKDILPSRAIRHRSFSVAASSLDSRLNWHNLQQMGYPPQQMGYPPQGYPPQGYPPQGYPSGPFPPIVQRAACFSFFTSIQ